MNLMLYTGPDEHCPVCVQLPHLKLGDTDCDSRISAQGCCAVPLCCDTDADVTLRQTSLNPSFSMSESSTERTDKTGFKATFLQQAVKCALCAHLFVEMLESSATKDKNEVQIDTPAGAASSKHKL